MKTITYFEPSELVIIDNVVGYYFRAIDGFLQKNDLFEPDSSLCDADMVNAHPFFENTDSKDIHEFICVAQNQRKKRLEKLEAEIAAVIAEINLNQSVLESFKTTDTLAQTMSAILKVINETKK